MAALIFNFLAGRPVSEVPGYEEPLSAYEAELERKAVALEAQEAEARTMAWLLESPKGDEEDSFKNSWASPAKRCLDDLLDAVEAEEEDDIQPKRLCFGI
jgi:hypothetical protein